MFTADPRIVPSARRLAHVGYEEMLEIAATGSGVLAFRAVEFVQPLEPEPVGPVEAVVVHLFERGLAVAAVVLVRRERRPLPGRVERLADEQTLRGNRVGDDVVHRALPARPAAVVHDDVGGCDRRGFRTQ